MKSPFKMRAIIYHCQWSESSIHYLSKKIIHTLADGEHNDVKISDENQERKVESRWINIKEMQIRK